MDRKTWFFSIAVGVMGAWGESPDFAWKLIQGFMHIWNHTDQGVCVALPGSASEGFKFTMMSLNLTKVLTNELNRLNRMEGNATWRTMESPFLEQKEGHPWKSNGTWIEHTRALYQLPSNSTWDDLWNRTCYRSLTPESSTEPTDPPAVPVPCTIVPWWDSPSENGYFEHEYSVRWAADWCIHIPARPGAASPVNPARYEWAWSLKRLFNPNRPLSAASDLPDGTGIGWEVGVRSCVYNRVRLPSGETLCWNSRKGRSAAPRRNGSWLSCSRVLNCSTGAGDPLETWYIPELRTFIRDMCTCWGYPNYGYRNQDERCNGSFSDPRTALSCGIPVTHGPDRRKVWSADGRREELPRDDPFDCFQARYAAPRGTVWACSDGKLYSQLNMYDMAGLRCSVGFPSTCPSRAFNFTSRRNRTQRDLGSPADVKEGMEGMQIPDSYASGQRLVLKTEAFFARHLRRLHRYREERGRRRQGRAALSGLRGLAPDPGLHRR